MHFYYLDESGCTGCNLQDQEQPIFVLGGISVRDEGWNATQEALAGAVNRYFGGSPPTGFELHANELLSPDGDGPFAGHDRGRRNDLARRLLRLVQDRRHDVHFYAVDKRNMECNSCSASLPYDTKTPYHLSYDYLVTYINSFVRSQLGQSARGMLIIDAKEEFQPDIERITRARRFEGPAAHRVKWIAEFSYPIDSQKNPMIQLSDLVVYCTRKFLEIDGGYRNDYLQPATQFYAECYSVIHDRLRRKEIVDRPGRGMDALNAYLRAVQAKPTRKWRLRYGVS